MGNGTALNTQRVVGALAVRRITNVGRRVDRRLIQRRPLVYGGPTIRGAANPLALFARGTDADAVMPV